MNYKIKQSAMEEINKRFKRKYFIENLGLAQCTVSTILNGHRACPKYTAYAITKVIDKNAEITDFFEEV